MEVWWRGFTADPVFHLGLVISTYFLLVIYNSFSGLRADKTWKGVFWDSVEELALAFVVSFLFLLLIGMIHFKMSLYEVTGKVIVETMIVAIGISVGTSQLGQKNERGTGKKENKKETGGPEELLKVFVLGICGSILFSSSVAPTMEILKIAIEVEIINILFMIVISLVLSLVVMFFIDFLKEGNRKVTNFTMVTHVMLCYVAALTTSFLLLWYFGRLEDYSLSVILSEIIVLAIPGSLGASAGRILID